MPALLTYLQLTLLLAPPSSALEIVGVDDRLDAVWESVGLEERLDLSRPNLDGVSLGEDLYRSGEKLVTVHYAKVPTRSAEHLALLRSWLTKVPLPKDRRFVFGADPRGGYRSYLVEATPFLTSNDVLAAERAAALEGGQAILKVTLSPSGRGEFARQTKRRAGTRIAIIVEGRVLSAPVVVDVVDSEAIYLALDAGGGADANEKEAQRIAALLSRAPSANARKPTVRMNEPPRGTRP